MDLCVIEETRLAAANVDILTVKSKNGDVKSRGVMDSSGTVGHFESSWLFLDFGYF